LKERRRREFNVVNLCTKNEFSVLIVTSILAPARVEEKVGAIEA
jgi:hypothetical protein